MSRQAYVLLLLVVMTGHGRVAGAGQGAALPAAVRDVVLESCRREVLEDVANDARSKGFGLAAEVVLDESSLVFAQEKRDRLKADGRGQFRYGPDYLLQPMTFSCEWDLAKEKLRKAGYKIPKGADTTALPPEKAVAVEACRRAVRSELQDMARRREYYSASIDLSEGLGFDGGERGLTLSGVVTFKLDSAQDQASEHEFHCVWDYERGSVVDLQTRPVDEWRRETGSVRCESRNFDRKSCTAPLGGRVRVRSTHSDTACVEGRNWSRSSREVVVWDGCRATFEFDMR